MALDHEKQARSFRLEGKIRRWAIIACLVFVVVLPVWVGIQHLRVVTSQFLNGQPLTKAGDVALAKTADLLESITPERRAELKHNLHRVAHVLEPYAAEMRPLWMACCAPEERPSAKRLSTKPDASQAGAGHESD